jgi:hypothetical protein
VKTERISPDTLVNDDLGVDGDDGSEFLEAYAERFDVDLSTINEVYFGPEGIPLHYLVTWPYHLVRWLLGHRAEPYPPLPVSQLIKSAEAGKWGNM